MWVGVKVCVIGISYVEGMRLAIQSEIIYRGIGNESRELYISTRASAGNAIWR